jgi:hypothetical protein
VLLKLRRELEGHSKDLGRLRAHIDRANHRLERDEELARSLMHSAKAAAAAELASNTSAKAKAKAGDPDSGEGSPSKEGAVPAEAAAAAAPEANLLAATDAKALEIDKYKQQYITIVRKYFYLYDFIKLLESGGKELLFYRCVADDGPGTGFFSNSGGGGGGLVSGAATRGGAGTQQRVRWVRREIELVEVTVHACHLYVPPVEEEGGGPSAAGGHARHHHHHSHHSHHTEPEPLADHLEPTKDELGRIVHKPHHLRLLPEEAELYCRRLGVPACPAAEVIGNLSYYHLSHGISPNEYALKMFRHHVDRFSGKLNPRPFVANHSETEATEVAAAVQADVDDMLRSPGDDDEEDAPFDFSKIGASPSEDDVELANSRPDSGGQSPFSIEPMSPGTADADAYANIMLKCSRSLKYVWPKDANAVHGLASPGGRHSPQRPPTASSVGEVDNDDPYLLPISHINNSTSQYIQYPLLQGHTVISSNHLLRGERVRCDSLVNKPTVKEQLEMALAQQEVAKTKADELGALGASALGREFLNMSADPTSGVMAAAAAVELHKIPPPMNHLNPQRMHRFQTHGAGTHLHTYASHLYNELVVYKFMGEPPAKFVQVQVQRHLCHEYERKMGVSQNHHHHSHEAVPDNCGVTSMDDLSYYIADPISKRANGGELGGS